MRIRNLLRPEYVFRPRNVLRRLRRRAFADQLSVVAPVAGTGLSLEVSPREYLGQSLLTFGVYDLVLSEALFRLLQPGGVGVDVGANIGYTAVLMGWRVGPAGRVVALEPLPSNFDRLVRNLERNALLGRPVRAVPLAASDVPGEPVVRLPDGFELNEGILSLDRHAADGGGAPGGREVRLKAEPLAAVLGDTPAVDVLKIDVEGHEEKVLIGAGDLIAGRRVRTVVFEDHNPYPTGAMSLLERSGYRLWQLRAGLFGPRLLPPDALLPPSLEPNWVATVAPDDVFPLLTRRGWHLL